ncbi:DUF1232 domain-containing protein [bacterium]|nr:DUF1232 domain-containing protein [bacterium]
MSPSAKSRLASLTALFRLPQMLRLAASLLTDPRVSIWLKVGAAAGVVYVFSPLDVIPDFTGIGMLDDIVITILILQTLIDLAPPHVVDQHCDRLGLKREELDMDVPQLIGQAIELIAGWWSSASAARAAFGEQQEPRPQSSAPRPRKAADAPAAEPAAPRPAAAAAPEPARTVVEEPPQPAPPAELPPSVKRYSAYREEKN